MLVGLHVWASRESYEVLGVFGKEPKFSFQRSNLTTLTHDTILSRMVLWGLFHGRIPNASGVHRDL